MKEDFRNYIRRFSRVNTREELDNIFLLNDRYNIQFVLSPARYNIKTYRCETFEEILSKIDKEINDGKVVYFYYLHHLKNGDWVFRASFK